MLSLTFGKFLAETMEKAEPSTGVVVFTGVSLVFAVLLILIIVLKVQGKIFTSIDKRKDKKSKSAAQEEAPVLISSAPQPPEHFIEQGIPAEVVAAIAAAVAAMEGGKYVLKSVQTIKTASANRWGTAGLLAYTEPF